MVGAELVARSWDQALACTAPSGPGTVEGQSISDCVYVHLIMAAIGTGLLSVELDVLWNQIIK